MSTPDVLSACEAEASISMVPESVTVAVARGVLDLPDVALFKARRPIFASCCNCSMFKFAIEKFSNWPSGSVRENVPIVVDSPVPSILCPSSAKRT